MLNFVDPIITKRRSGSFSDPFRSITETLTIDSNGKIILNEIPDSFQKVAVTGNNTTWSEIVGDNSSVISNTQYQVDYASNIVSFNPSNAGKQLTFVYKGTGVQYVPASIIYTQSSNGNVIQTLKDVTDSATGIIANEATRVSSESTRVSNESTRTTNETARQNAETSRSTAESTRVTNETTRVSSESTRVSNETTRGTQETARVSAESNRATAEGNRATAETTRSTNETGRVNAETTRASSETTRQQNETTRQTQETSRQTNTTNAINSINTATNNLKMNFQTPVANFAAITTTYPSPQIGWVVQALDTGNFYRYDGTVWQFIQQINNTMINDNSNKIGVLSNLTTSVKTDLVSAINSNVSSLADKASQSFVYDKLPVFTQWKDIIFGREHLIAFHNKIGQGNGAKIVFSGDSTTDGYGVQTSEWYIDQAVKKALDYNGFSSVSVVRRGQSGMSTEHWNRTYVTGDIAENPDLLVLRWGINDPAYDINLNHLADDGQNYNIRRNAQNFKDSLYAGLQQIRNTKSYSTCSILLMTPNSTSDDISFRNEKWHEEINSIIRVAARQFNCVFIDTYRLWQDSRNATGFMDIINQGHIHPLAMMNLWIADVIYHTCFPQLFRDYYNEFNKEKLVTPSNSWANFGGVFTNLGYVKENHKKIRLQGWMQNGTRSQGTIIGNFPAPSKQQNIKGAAENGEATFYVETSGVVKIWSVPATGWICLDGGTYIL